MINVAGGGGIEWINWIDGSGIKLLDDEKALYFLHKDGNGMFVNHCQSLHLIAFKIGKEICDELV